MNLNEQDEGRQYFEFPRYELPACQASARAFSPYIHAIRPKRLQCNIWTWFEGGGRCLRLFSVGRLAMGTNCLLCLFEGGIIMTPAGDERSSRRGSSIARMGLYARLVSHYYYCEALNTWACQLLVCC